MDPLLQVRNIRQAYTKEASADFIVLDNVDLTMQSGEIVGLLGRSGSGKSTLLRIVSGLLRPTAGEVVWRGAALQGPAPGVAMVFQSFALFPWLTVQENVEIGLEAQGIRRAERRERAEAAIDLIGLGGYESAYPKEMSGGMRQRVGLARALVVHPDLLLMDEPFSALDVLTAETLRTDLIDLWMERKLPVKSVLLVTHNIEEAVLMCDRILVFSSNPGRVAQELRVPFAHPRNRHDAAFRKFVDDIYALMTRRATSVPAPSDKPVNPMTQALHPVSTNLMAGLLEILAGAQYSGRADLPPLAAALQLELDDLLPLGEALQMVGFALLEEGDIKLTEARPPLCPGRHRRSQGAVPHRVARARAARRDDPRRARRTLEPSRLGGALPRRAGRPHVARLRRGHAVLGHQLGPLRRALQLRRRGGPVLPRCGGVKQGRGSFLKKRTKKTLGTV